MSGFTPSGPVDARHYMSEYFRLERWEIPPADGTEGFSEFGGRVPLDGHHRGAGGGLRTGALLTNLDSVGGLLAGLSVLPRWIVTTSLMVTVTRLDHAGPLRVRGHVLRRGRNAVVASLQVVDEGRDDGLVAASLGTFAVLDPGELDIDFQRPVIVPMPPPSGDLPSPEDVLRHRARYGTGHPPAAGRPAQEPVGHPPRWSRRHAGRCRRLSGHGGRTAGRSRSDPSPSRGPAGRRRYRAPLPASRPGRADRSPLPGARRAPGRTLVRVAVHDTGADDRLVALGSVVVLAV